MAAVVQKSLEERLLESFFADKPAIEWGGPALAEQRWLHWDDQIGQYVAGSRKGRDTQKRYFDELAVALDWVLSQ